MSALQGVKVIEFTSYVSGPYAGMLLADSEYRHELEADIEPFKGLLLGLFFITVGAGIDFDLAAQIWQEVVFWAAVVIAAKFIVLAAVGWFYGLREQAPVLLESCRILETAP